jgi:hypothetical protein
MADSYNDDLAFKVIVSIAGPANKARERVNT